MEIGVDVGGTFTDAVVQTGGGVVTAKAPTTPGDQSDGVLAAVSTALAAAGVQPGDVTGFSHGTTTATNALLEGRGARTALIATAGFTDVIELGRQARADLYRLCAAHAPAPVEPALRFGAPERMGFDGPIRPLAPADAHALAERVAAAEPEAVAVALLHAYRHPEHELAVGEALRRVLPDVHVSLSHAAVGTFREYERTLTTAIDARLSPLLGSYLRALAQRSVAAGLPEPAIMQSNGGLIDAATAADSAARTVLSGPAGGAAGAAIVAASAGVRDALCFDMGGTSCDVCLIEDGKVAESDGRQIGGYRIALPMLDIHTVGAGGGSIAWRDAGGALRVGPRSAGAVPGPACYGRGGTEPTVTDANLVLGRLPADGTLAGGVALDRDAADRAVAGLAGELGLALTECAEAILSVAVAEMVRALRVVTVERGVDPRGLTLLAFGGAGPLHACAVAEELGMTRILCARSAGVLAALGLVASDRRRDVQRSAVLRGADLTAAEIRERTAALAARAREELGDAGAELTATYAVRYRGQAFELALPGPLDAEPDLLMRGLAEAHEQRFGFADPEGELELVTIRVTASSPRPPVALAAAPGAEPPRASRRPVRAGGLQHEALVLQGEPSAGTAIDGPAVVELPESTLLVASGWTAAAQSDGTLIVERSA